MMQGLINFWYIQKFKYQHKQRWIEGSLKLAEPLVAVFSKEWGLSDLIPIWSGGLGILNGDMLLTSADLGYHVGGIGLMYHKGYLKQEIVGNRQQSHPVDWDPEKQGFELLPERPSIEMYGHKIKIAPWRKRIKSDVSGKSVDLILLDADVEGNPEWIRRITDCLYDNLFTVPQNVLLGVGGVEVVQKLGYDVTTYHMQEGHASTLALKLLQQKGGNRDAVRELCIFSNHTPISAGMPEFPYGWIEEAIGYLLPKNREELRELAGENCFNTNLLPSNLSRYTNGVARMHCGVLKAMPLFCGKKIGYVTNGVHWRWMSERQQAALDATIASASIQEDWRIHPELLSQVSLNQELLEKIHRKNRADLVDLMNERALADEHTSARKIGFSTDTFTAGFAKRFTPYKRASLPLSAPLHQLPGKIQLPYSGKAHPNDSQGLDMLELVLSIGRSLNHNVSFGFIPDYSIKAGKLMTGGCDLWLITPEKEKEASGTSGMKALLNGNPDLSNESGFWPEVKGRHGEVGYTFSGDNQEEEVADFIRQLDGAMRDHVNGKISANRARRIVQAWQRFGSVRMMRQYGKVYGFEEKKQSLEKIVEAAIA